MRNKKPFSFDEKRDAEIIILEGFPNKLIDNSKMYLVAKYFRHTLGYGAIRLERELIKFCKTNDPNFNPITEADSIKKWIKSAMNYGLRKVDSITISEEQVKWFETIKIEKHRKILFVTLVLSKALKGSSSRINNKHVNQNPSLPENYYIRYNNLPDIIRLSQIASLTETDLTNMFCDYTELFTFYNPEKELIKLEYIKDNSKGKDMIIDLENIIGEYERIFEKRKIAKETTTKRCIICGKELEVIFNNKQKTCSPECSEKLERKRKAEWYKEKKQ